MSTELNAEMKKEGRSLLNVKVLFVLILIVQLAILYFVISPVNVLQQLNIVQVMNEVSALTAVPPTEVPSIVAVIGDNKNLPDIATIQKQNEYNAAVYKDAQNGDYVIAFSSSMVIYRRSENKIIYSGSSPVALQTKQQTDLTNAVTKAAKAKEIIAEASIEVPQLSIVADVTKLQGSNSKFYANAADGDIVAIYSQAEKILIYRPTTGDIVNSGEYAFNID